MKRINPEIRKETWEQQSAAGRYNPAEVMVIGKIEYMLNSGTSDELTIWSDKDGYLVLIVNRGLGYIGLDEYLKGNRQPAGGIFIQSEDESKEILGKNWEDKTENYLRRVLVNYL